MILIFIFSILIPVSPLYTTSLSRDSGVYEYVSWRIINGAVVYKDVWDHKPPVIFLLNVISFKLFGLSQWSIWILEFVFILLSVFILYITLARLFSSNVAFLISILFIICIAQLGIYNSPELYSLLFQLMLIYLFLFGAASRIKLNCLLMGFLTALCFYTKQTCAGIGVIIGLWFIFEFITRKASLKVFFSKIGFLCLGFFIPTIIILLYFLFNNSLETFWSAAFLYNFAQIYSSIFAKINAMIFGLDLLRQFTGLSIFALAGWFLSLYLIHPAAGSLTDIDLKKYQKLIFLISIGVVVETVLSGISPFAFDHYYLTLLPVFCLSTALLIYMLYHLIQRTEVLLARYMLLVFLLLILSIQFSSRSLYWPFSYRNFSSGQAEIVNYIDNNSAPNDSVLLVGAESSINFLAKRVSPTRFVYQYPLANELYTNQKMLDVFFSDIQKNKPRLIIDTKNSRILSGQYYNPNLLYSLFKKDWFIRSCPKDPLATNTYKLDIYVCNW